MSFVSRSSSRSLARCVLGGCVLSGLTLAGTGQGQAQPQALDAPTAASASPSRLAPADLRTRHATFRRADFDELPGWHQDDLSASWPAFLRSCEALMRRDNWRETCTLATRVPNDPAAQRAFYESRFALLRILNTDASRDGDITGYFEPLLDGRRRRQGAFDVPVLGVPRDLYTLDWMDVPPALRQGVVPVKVQGQQLVVQPVAEPGSLLLDLSRFELDTKDRRLRVRVTRAGSANATAEPYPARADLLAMLGRQSGVDAPVLAWVDDALALYAMQIQGSGRIRLEDGLVLRVQYADQNGHPFKPLRVVAKPAERPTTRSIGVTTSPQASSPDEFMLEDADPPDTTGVVTRGWGRERAPEPDRAKSQDAATNAVIEALLGGRPKEAGVPAPAPAPTGAAAAGRPGTALPAMPASPVRTTAPANAARPAAQADAQAGTQATVQAATPAPATGPRKPFDAQRLLSDPSYVFFKAAANQTPVGGPTGALGVPLTPGRSVAIDPRVTPLGYPVFLSTPALPGTSVDMKRLVFAQDTGGAIRGAVRADFFWGFGAEAGRLARGTRQRGEMWLLMPAAEASRLKPATGVVTRGIGSAPSDAGECLVADDSFCREPD